MAGSSLHPACYPTITHLPACGTRLLIHTVPGSPSSQARNDSLSICFNVSKERRAERLTGGQRAGVGKGREVW